LRSLALHVDFDLNRPTGIGRYGYEMVRSLDRTGHMSEVWVNRDQVRAGLFQGLQNAKVVPFPFPRRISGRLLPALAVRRGIAIVHNPMGGMLPSAIPQAAMVHDMGPFLFPDQKDAADTAVWRARLSHVVKKARVIVTNSRTTAEDLLNLHPGLEGRVRVTYLGVDHFTWNSDHVPGGKHILLVGTVEPRKNYGAFISAYSDLVAGGFQPPVAIIAGVDGFQAENVRRLVMDKGLSDRVLFTGYLDEDRLRDLYSGAACLVHPSLYEGFGLTLPEAFSWNLPVASSDRGSLGELFKDSVWSFDPGNRESMTRAIRDALEKGVTPGQREARKEVHRRYTWANCADLTVRALLPGAT